MKVRAFIGLLLLLALAFSACSKDETVAPCGATNNDTLRNGSASFAPDQAGTAQRDPATAGLRDGDPSQGGGSGEGGGISDDGDDGSDSEENKKTGH